ncbi:MAG: T9SS type A sorting domain-containing protein [Bacteroidales bacterium]|nr:T9SS type A sorting domain-containing protein [Bacteroidales bacterium]
MERKKKLLSLLLLGLFCAIPVTAQQTIPATGGNGMGSGGTVSFTVGQLVWHMFPGSIGTVLQGVQQPYEISVVTSIENTEHISLVCTVYPNPTRGQLKLIVESEDYKSLRFQLYDINGTVQQDKQILDRETEITMDNLFSSVNFLRIIRNNKEIKVFKIIKL